MSLVRNIEGSLASDEMKNLINYLYSNLCLGKDSELSITKSPIIKIKGNYQILINFLDYIESIDTTYFIKLGIENPIFIENKNDENSFEIDDSNFQDQLDNIMVHYC